jgi:GntR family transcriptional regulator
MTEHRFPTWQVDKKSGVPLYLQVKELIRQHVVSGSARRDEKLPSVHEVSEALGITFETVRKAYKALASEGVISMSRGRRSVASPAPDPAASVDLLTRTKGFLATELLSHLDVNSAREMVEQAFRELSRDAVVIFTECNQLQVDQLSADLGRHLGVSVQGVLLGHLSAEVERARRDGTPSLVLTTGFHVNEVRKAIEGMDIEIDCVVTSMSPDTRRVLQSFAPGTRFGIVCPAWESVPFYRDVIVAELGLNSEILCGILSDVDDLLTRVDVLLCAAPVFERVRRIAPEDIQVFNVFDRLDPSSLLVIRERLGALRQPTKKHSD